MPESLTHDCIVEKLKADIADLTHGKAISDDESNDLLVVSPAEIISAVVKSLRGFGLVESSPADVTVERDANDISRVNVSITLSKEITS